MPHGPDPYVPVHELFGINLWWYAVAALVVLILCGLVVAAKAKS